jgi:hypothetical protein
VIFVAARLGSAGEVMAETDVILTPDQQVRVFISSTLEKLAADYARLKRHAELRKRTSRPSGA